MKQLMILTVFLALTGTASAELALDYLQFDPPIIASGDRVDITVQFHHVNLPLDDLRIGNPDYRFQVTLEPDDTLTEKYVTFEDAQGDDLPGIISRGEYYNKRFTIKLANNAPPGNYEFRLAGQWLKDGRSDGTEQYLRFEMPVKKEGISLSIANVLSNPEKVRAGDKNVLLTTSVTNTGEKTAKNVRIRLEYPDGISSSYTNDNQLTIGTVEPMQTVEVKFYVDTDRELKESDYKISYFMSYLDLDNNNYQTSGTFPFVVKKKPNIVVLESSGTALAGQNGELRIVLSNIGEETADSVDVRLLKQSSQPFELDVRSDYVGQLKPGQNATAIFNLKASSEAEIKEHNFNVLIRARGDSEEGDDNIYTFTESATLDVTGKAPNPYPMIGAGLLIVIVIVSIVARARKR